MKQMSMDDVWQIGELAVSSFDPVGRTRALTGSRSLSARRTCRSQRTGAESRQRPGGVRGGDSAPKGSGSTDGRMNTKREVSSVFVRQRELTRS
jgi:hypothetical protein